MYGMQSKMINQQDRKSITADVKMRKLYDDIPDFITMQVPHNLTNDILDNDIVTMFD